MGSRSLQIGGSALYKASEEVLAQAKRLAAHLLEANVDDIVLHDGGKARRRRRAGDRADVGRARAGRERSGAATRRLDRRRGLEALASELDFNQGEATFPFGAHIAVVEVDTETGEVELPAPRRGRRLRPHPQPAARRRPAARRDRAGRRAGAVRRRRLRRRRQPAHREPHGLRDAERGRAPVVRGVATPRRRRRSTRSARRASASRARSARRPRCRTRSSTRCRTSGSATSTCRCTAERVWRAIQDAPHTAEPRCRSPTPTLRLTADAVPGDRRPLLRRPSRRSVRPARRPARRRAEPDGDRHAVFPCRNADASALTYTVDSRDLIAAMRAAEARGRRARRRAGTRHTHTDAYPSAPTCGRPSTRLDLRDREPASTASRSLRAYRIRDGEIAEVEVQIV